MAQSGTNYTPAPTYIPPTYPPPYNTSEPTPVVRQPPPQPVYPGQPVYAQPAYQPQPGYQPAYASQPNYPPQGNPQGAYPAYQAAPYQPGVYQHGAQEGLALSPKQVNVLFRAKQMKIQSIISCFLILVFFLALFWLVVLLPLALTGFLAARKLSRPMTFTYVGVIAIVICLRIFLVIVLPYVIFIVIMCIVIVLEIFAIVRALHFAKLIGELNPQELDDCRRITLGQPRRPVS
mmetsp:Transcript_12016/g.22952  ORF Transcript_12016/g.22952 Transcript_12016/m.22952 type:complete len:234 (+) Transcript_12016:29-730(+)